MLLAGKEKLMWILKITER